MTINYNWIVTSLDCYPQTDNETDVVFNVHWTCMGSDGTYTASVYSTCNVSLDPEEPFTPYADLTQDQVLGWIWENGIDKDATEESVAKQVENLINPPVVSPPLPWVTPITEDSVEI